MTPGMGGHGITISANISKCGLYCTCQFEGQSLTIAEEFLMGKYPLVQVKIAPAPEEVMKLKLKRITRLGNSSQSVFKIRRCKGFYVTLEGFGP